MGRTLFTKCHKDPPEGLLEEIRGVDFPWARYLDSSPGVIRQELHRARDSGLCWVSEQEIQFCWVDFFIHQKYLQFQTNQRS